MSASGGYPVLILSAHGIKLLEPHTHTGDTDTNTHTQTCAHTHRRTCVYIHTLAQTHTQVYEEAGEIFSCREMTAVIISCTGFSTIVT